MSKMLKKIQKLRTNLNFFLKHHLKKIIKKEELEKKAIMLVFQY